MKVNTKKMSGYFRSKKAFENIKPTQVLKRRVVYLSGFYYEKCNQSMLVHERINVYVQFLKAYRFKIHKT